jgi:alkanesulfonate monooxygenase SsuD/methylene tetrahydromethanopterin reductase-like flavin-dependent oxidoreductase (luciferase family)
VDQIKFGVHIPVMGFSGKQPTKEQIISLAHHAEALGYDSLSVNDHIVFHTSWLDAISTLSAIAASTTRILIGTSILNIVVRNPVVCAKALAAIDILSSGRLFAGVGPGSHRGDYDACGIDFSERWPRFSEALEILVTLLSDNNNSGGVVPFSYKGKYYTLKDVVLTPKPVQKPHPPVYVGSWGSDVGLKRLAKYSNGWMASAYNITPAKFKEKWNFLLAYRKSLGKEEEEEPLDNSIMSMFGYIDDDKDKVRNVVKEILSPALRRPAEELEQMLLFGSLDECLQKIRNLADAGVKRIHFWPVLDYKNQIRIFKNGISAYS